MKRSLIILMLLPIMTKSQNANEVARESYRTGIKWTQGLNWEEVKDKAKKENKYIFLDAYTTWCGPCKRMDRDIYPKQELGDYYNQRFVSVRVQMDKTPNDDEQIKGWYKDAELIYKKYHIDAYPTLMYFNPQGEIVHKLAAFQSVEDLIRLAEIATQPGRKYDDPFTEFDQRKKSYENGIKIPMDRYPYMITKAFESGDVVLGKQLVKEHTDYCLTLSPEERYTTENIRMWHGLWPGSKTRIFQFFSKDGEIIDKVMNQKGYSQIIVKNAIQNEIMWPFFKEESKDLDWKVSLETAMLYDPTQKPIYAEADWKKLFRMLRETCGKVQAKRILFDSKLIWYRKLKNGPAFAKYYIQLLKTMDDIPIGMLNNDVFDVIFLYVTDKHILSKFIPIMKKAIERNPQAGGPPLYDTYANLLYKAEKKQEAILWQKKAVNAGRSESEKEKYTKILEQMKRGEPTYLNRGAIWK